MAMPWWGWVLSYVAFMLAVAFLIGRVIRNRDRQTYQCPTRAQVEALVQDLQEYAQGRQVSRSKMLDLPPRKEETDSR